MSVLVRICLPLFVLVTNAQERCGSYADCECRSDRFCYDMLTGRELGPASSFGIYVDSEGYRTVDRVFLGRKVPTGLLRERRQLDLRGEIDQAALRTYEAGYLIYDFSTLVQALFGDYIYTRKKTRKEGAAPNPNKYINVPPMLSVAQWVQAFRDAERLRNVHPFIQPFGGVLPGGR